MFLQLLIFLLERFIFFDQFGTFLLTLLPYQSFLLQRRKQIPAGSLSIVFCTLKIHLHFLSHLFFGLADLILEGRDFFLQGSCSRYLLILADNPGALYKRFPQSIKILCDALLQRYCSRIRLLIQCIDLLH